MYRFLIVLALLVAGCGDSEPEPSTSPLSEASFGDVVTCESVLAADPSEAENCAYESDPTSLMLVGVSETETCTYVVFDRQDSDGTWFGVFGGDWQELDVEEFTQDRIATECEE